MPSCAGTAVGRRAKITRKGMMAFPNRRRTMRVTSRSRKPGGGSMGVSLMVRAPFVVVVVGGLRAGVPCAGVLLARVLLAGVLRTGVLFVDVHVTEAEASVQKGQGAEQDADEYARTDAGRRPHAGTRAFRY